MVNFHIMKNFLINIVNILIVKKLRLLSYTYNVYTITETRCLIVGQKKINFYKLNNLNI